MESLKIDKPIRLIELFAGIGSQAKALQRLGADFEHYRVCEFDKYAIKSYNAIHGTNFVTSDITQITADDLGIVDTDKYCYIMTYSFPCQDLSLAGKQKGMAKGENTRSGLLWEVERLLNECNELPQILLMENVTQVHGKKNKEHFAEWIAFLESKGYSNYWKDLNAKNFGIPQNRNRTFMVSVLGDYTYEFPEEFPLELRLKDMLEDSVDEKYYLSVKQLNYAIDLNDSQKGTKWEGRANSGKLNPEIAMTLGVRSAGGGQRVGVSNFVIDNINEEISVEQYKNFLSDKTEPVRLGYIPYPNSDKPHQSNTFYDPHAISPTLDTCEGGNRQVKIVDPFIVRSVGRNPDNPSDRTPGIYLEQRLEPNFSGCANCLTTVKKDNYVAEPLAYDEQNGYIRRDGTVGTLTTDGSSPKHNNRVVESEMRIRKLTPKECWRLMGFDDVDFYKAKYYTEQEVITLKLRSSKKYRDLPLTEKIERTSNGQLYKQAGNSICVDVLCYIFGQML